MGTGVLGRVVAVVVVVVVVAVVVVGSGVVVGTGAALKETFECLLFTKYFV